MGERQDSKQSAIIFGARNLGRAVIETLVADGWAVTGVARSQATLDGVREAGALALKADVTDPASVHAALEEAASTHGGIDLAVNAASASGRFALAQGRAATLIQVTGGSARRAMPSRGLWAAGSFGVKAITNAAALELRPHGIQVTLLIIDAGIQPLTGAARPGVAPATLADPHQIADAIRFLANQGARAATHELQLTPLAENWTP